jgi:ribosomal protein RSM22 (predicted rRNA methylase)
LIGARELIGTKYLADARLRAEYEKEIAPRTTAALAKVLGELFGKNKDAASVRRVLDLGAGTGAVTRALRARFGQGQQIVEVDQVAVGPQTRVVDVTSLPALTALGGPFDLVIAAHVLNELFVADDVPRRAARLSALVRGWCEKLLARGGTLILIEPALRETSRMLLMVRDQVLAAGLHVVAPCFFTGPCPALLQERDWCHDNASNGSQRRVDFSYLVIRGHGDVTSDPARFRIVSDPLPEKGRLRLFGCGISGRHPIVRLDRNASAVNSAMDQLVRGDVARISRTTFAQDGLRIDGESPVTREP